MDSASFYTMLPSTQEYTLASCCLVLLLCAVVYKARKAPGRFPPGTEGLPLIGSLTKVGGTNAERVLAEWGWMHYGPVFYVKIGGSRVVVLNTFEAVQEGFLKNGNSLSGRFASHSATAFPDYSPKWKEQRRSRINALKSFEKQDLEAVILQQADKMCKTLEGRLEGDAETGFMPAEFTTLATFEIVSMVVCGFPIHKNADRGKFLRLLMDPIYNQTCRGLFSCPYAMSSDALPPFLISSSQASQRKRTEHVLEHIRSAESQDFLGGINAKLRSSTTDTDECFDEQQLTGYVTDLFLAGTDTMATAVAWSVVLLAANPKRQTRLQDEIGRILGGRAPTMADIDGMHYTRAVIQEVFRMRPVFPLSISHKSTSEVSVLGFTIPKDTTVISNLWAVHNDAKYWKKPEKFQPERHLDTDNNNQVFVKSDRVIPFSIGPRYCLGGQLATMQHFIFLVRLMQEFRFEPVGSSGPDLEGATSIVLAPRGVRVRATLR